MMLDYQLEVIDNVKSGYVGNLPGEKVWTLSSSLMFSLTIFTTIGQWDILSSYQQYEIVLLIGYGNLTPKTVLGKAMTMVYAIFGIPLMFIYMV